MEEYYGLIWTIVFIAGLFLLAYVQKYLSKEYGFEEIKITIDEQQLDSNYPSELTNQAKFLKIKICNLGVSKGFHWLRKTAKECFGVIRFHDIETGDSVFKSVIPVRFSNGKNPFYLKEMDDGYKWVHQNRKIYNKGYIRNIRPGNSEVVTLASRFDDEGFAHFWINSKTNRIWKSPDWKLENKKYIVSVILQSKNRVGLEVFLLDNTGDINDFRLIEATDEHFNFIFEEVGVEKISDLGLFVPTPLFIHLFPFENLIWDHPHSN